jgi:phage gpG-like protein
MALKITGDFAKVDRWAKRLRDLEKTKRALLANIGEEAVELVKEGFDRQGDPYGKAWKGTKRGGRILQDTGALKNSFHRKSLSSSRVVIGPGVGYAGFHQSGTSRMVARPMLPNRGLPKTWSTRIKAIAEEVMRRALT